MWHIALNFHLCIIVVPISRLFLLNEERFTQMLVVSSVPKLSDELSVQGFKPGVLAAAMPHDCDGPLTGYTVVQT